MFWLGSFFRKTLADANSPVQEKALDALIAYLRAADADAGRFVLFELFLDLSLIRYLCLNLQFLSPICATGMPRKFAILLWRNASLVGRRRWRRLRLPLCYGSNWRLLTLFWYVMLFVYSSSHIQVIVIRDCNCIVV